ncbi:Lrp/AsnC family leucine-responsive transcriptional regulator [Sporomusaceae bacterium BoRhaA]|uniref:Lrp/AsnC family transcriptional regulator n=1 Tax=Pelorhabdus rhamnosifermentans TaxID=2772457 RepID=UPI001FED0DA5|nr:Lrp/AsnC family transcriptional regulator [Pelorhabdus rhamnosifermentans]MBU2700191.1 Lrp/AsnC family leucine-responsive transcriptional regulator [Pelorhabdus rhamnosifermentans]
MDSNDFKVIKQLMEQARTTWAELGTLLGLSAPAAAERVRKLEELGVIKGYSALINPEEIGCGLAALISVTLERPEQKKEFLTRVNNLPEILECHHIAGAEDYILKVRCSGTRDLERLISEKIKSLSGIKTRTTVILSTVKETPILPIKFERG